MSSVMAFVQYFQLRGAHSTVMTKAMQLKNLAEAAEVYYTSGDAHAATLKKRAIEVKLFLRSVFNAEKTETRKVARRKKPSEDRAARAVILVPEDFKRCTQVAVSEMKSVRTFFETSSKKSIHRVEQLLRKRNLIGKFCIHLTVTLLLTGGGQRPQVFTQLQLPSDSELASIRSEAASNKFFELRTLQEKTTRALDMPNVVFSHIVLPYLIFYMDIVRPIIVMDLGIEEDPGDDNPLLMDTRNGDTLRTGLVRHTLRGFLKSIDPELTKVTPMSLRASYATMMLKKYRDGTIFNEKSEDEFLASLAKAMNTSVEQLSHTYAGLDRSDFHDIAKELTFAMEGMYEEANDLSESDKED